jgi:hypothetical protein
MIKNGSLNILKWSGYILNSLFLISMLYIIVANAMDAGLPDPLTQPLPVRIELFCMCSLMCGMIVVYWKQWFGGLIETLSMACFVVTESICSGKPPALMNLFGLLLLTGLVNTAVGLIRRSKAKT